MKQLCYIQYYMEVITDIDNQNRGHMVSLCNYRRYNEMGTVKDVCLNGYRRGLYFKSKNN